MFDKVGIFHSTSKQVFCCIRSHRHFRQCKSFLESIPTSRPSYVQRHAGDRSQSHALYASTLIHPLWLCGQ